MPKSIKKLLSLALAVVLAVACLPVAALAESEVPALPTASATNLEVEGLAYAANFLLDTPSNEQSDYYGPWNAEIEVSFNKAVTLNASGTGDGYLSARNEAIGVVDWTALPMSEISLAAGETFNIMEYVFTLSSGEVFQPRFYELRDSFANVDLGLYLSPDFLAANPDVMATVNVRLYNDTESHILTSAEFGMPELPTATIKELKEDTMTFALNFKAETPTNSQAAFYGKWYADFVLTINKDVTFDANGGADGYLAGQYDEWSPNWVNVPIEPVSVKANEPLKIMQFAAKMLNKPGLKYTYSEIVGSVKDFDCGVYFTPEFLQTNPDLEVSLELRMYNPVNEDESYSVGDTFEFGIPELPTATATDYAKDDLTFAMNFKTNSVTSEQLNYYGDWFADFELTVNKDVTFDANGNSDGHLAGQYDGEWEDWHGEWVNVPFKAPVSLKANKTVKIMEFAAEQMNEPGLKYTYREVYEVVKDFYCGVYFTPEFLAANPDLKVTLELKMYNPEDETENYVIGDTYVFENDSVAINKETGKTYTDLATALKEAKAGQTVLLVRDVADWWISVQENTTLDLNGNVLTADYTSVYGAIIDDSTDNSGRLVTPASAFLKQDSNPQLPILTDSGYAFVEILKFNTLVRSNGTEFVFQPMFETVADAMLLNRIAESGVTVQVDVTWRNAGENGIRSQNFLFDASFFNEVIGSRQANGKYSRAFSLKINSTNIENLTFTAKVVSAGVIAYS